MNQSNNSGRVLLFGTFDPLHEGHRRLFQQARALGNYLTVIVARDSVIASQKSRTSYVQEHDRLAFVAQDVSVDTALLGDVYPDSYVILTSTAFDILALGYDQAPSDTEVRKILDSLNLAHVRIVRLAPHRPDMYKSSLLRT